MHSVTCLGHEVAMKFIAMVVPLDPKWITSTEQAPACSCTSQVGNVNTHKVATHLRNKGI